MKASNRRNIFLINPKLQYSFIAFSVIVSLISISVFYLATHYLFWKFEQTGYSVGIQNGHIFYRFINDQRSLMNIIMLVTAPIITGLTCYAGLKFSNRVAGPIYRLTKHLEHLNEANLLNEVKFRDKDYFIELQNEFNKFIKNNKK